MQIELIQSYLKTFNAPQTFYFEQASSTMDLAKELVESSPKYTENKIHQGSNSGILVIAKSQTEGRGRSGKVWHSPEEGGLYFTIADLTIKQTQGLSLSIGASLCESLRKLNIPIGLKWPNDIIYFPISAKEAKKIGGILIETIVSGSETKAAFIGIGINVNNKEFPVDVPGISLSQIANKEILVNEIFELIIKDLIDNLAVYSKTGFSSFKSLWRKHSLMFGSKISVNTGSETFDCVVDDIADDGALLVKVNSEVKVIHSAEVSFIGTQKNLSISQTIDSYIADFFDEIPESERAEILSSLNDPLPNEEELVKEAETGKDITIQIKDMKLGQKIKTAMLGNMGARGMLIRENSRQIRQAVMKNPRLSENEVYEFAKNSNLDKHVFQMIGNDNTWMKSYPIQVAIVSNPKTPMEISLRWIKYLKDKELKDLSKSRNIPSSLATQVRKLLETRNKKPGGSGH